MLGSLMVELLEASRRTIFVIVGVVVAVGVIASALILTQPGGGSSENREARFTFSPSAPKVGVAVNFRDNSSGSPVEWSWDFGDNGTSSSQNPSHTYASEGTFSVTLTVRYSDGTTKSATRSITVSPELPPGVYTVYSDAGICPDEVPPVDVWVWSGEDWGLDPPVLVEGKYVMADAPEGTEVFACTSGSGSSNYVGWGVFLGADAAAGHQWVAANSVNLSSYSKLEFWVKSEVNLKVELEELPSASPENNPNARGKKSTALRISNYGWDSNQPDTWQKISIPVSAIRGVDLTKIRCPFMVTGEGGNKTFYVDEVVYIP